MGIIQDLFQVFGQQTIENIIPLIYYTFGIAVYGIIIFHFYRILAKRDIFGINLAQYAPTKSGFIGRVFSVILYGIKYLILFPILTFIWFSILSILLLAMSRSQSLETLLLVAMAIVASARVTAYYNEDLSRDLSKMLPFAMLGVFIIERTLISPESIVANISEIPSLLPTILSYALFTVIIEFILRTYWEVFHLFSGKFEKEIKAEKKRK